MQAASCLVGVQPIFPTKPRIVVKTVTTCLINSNNNSGTSPVKSSASSSRTFKTLSFNYNSPFSVFPAEACEIVGGNACEADVYPEAKLDTQPNSTNPNTNAIQHIDREYFDYSTDPKSVLRDEACDDLGGEFCEAS